MAKNQQKKSEFKDILRIGDKEVYGVVPIYHAISRAQGAGLMFANAVCEVLKLDRNKQAGKFSSAELKKIEDCIRDPKKYKIPTWLFNRKKDRETGEHRHLISSDLDLTQKFDIRFLRKIKSYRGLRHARGRKGLKVRVRGQRTRTTGRSGKTVGVAKKKSKK